MPPYPVLVLQNDPAEGLGFLEDALATAGLKARVIECFAGERVPSTISGHSHLIVLGGPQAAYNAPHVPYLQDEMRALREAVATRTPVLGVCLGAQLLAHATGGRAFAGPRPEIGWSRVARSEAGRFDRVLRHLPDETVVFQAHGDTFDLPPGATRLAGNAAFANQAFAMPYDAYGVQFHLEWTPALIASYLAAIPDADLARAGVTRAEIAEATPARVDAAREAARDVFGAFLAECGCHD